MRQDEIILTETFNIRMHAKKRTFSYTANVIFHIVTTSFETENACNGECTFQASKLDIPLIRQEDSYSCVPICLKMILDFLNEFLKETSSDVVLPSFEVADIAKIVNTREDGTLLDDVKNLNQNKDILRAIPSIEIETKMLCNLNEIETEVSENRPVIAWLVVSTNGRKFKHSVVVTGLDIENHLIFYNDPFFGKQQANIGSFVSMWEKMDRTLIKVKIGKRKQRLLEEWLRTRTQQGGEMT